MDENSASVLLSLLDRAVLKCVGDAEYVDVAFSGGLDSSLIAVLAKKHAKVKGYSVGMKESHDAQWCAHAASLIGIDHIFIPLTREEVISCANEFLDYFKVDSFLMLSYELPVYILLKKCGGKVILSGQGADELFAGYKRYLNVGVERLNDILKKDYEKAKNERLMEIEIAAGMGKVICYPFMEKEVEDFAFSLPAHKKINNGERKVMLRVCARIAGVPEEICNKEKKAIQYSTGIYKVLVQNWKTRGFYS